MASRLRRFLTRCRGATGCWMGSAGGRFACLVRPLHREKTNFGIGCVHNAIGAAFEYALVPHHCCRDWRIHLRNSPHCSRPGWALPTRITGRMTQSDNPDGQTAGGLFTTHGQPLNNAGLAAGEDHTNNTARALRNVWTGPAGSRPPPRAQRSSRTPEPEHDRDWELMQGRGGTCRLRLNGQPGPAPVPGRCRPALGDWN